MLSLHFFRPFEGDPLWSLNGIEALLCRDPQSVELVCWANTQKPPTNIQNTPGPHVTVSAAYQSRIHSLVFKR